jgi:hypothetical protein
MCIVKALQAQSNSPLGYGSEFWKGDMSCPLLHLHPNWECFEKLLNNGLDWPLEDILELDCMDNVNKALTFGNHKGASSNPVLLLLLMSNDSIHGFIVPFPLEKMANILGILFVPLNIQEQNTINSTGRIDPSKRLTHNQSYQWSLSGTSVNSRTRKANLLPCVYGGVVCRLVNWAVAARQKYPTT